MTAPFAWLFDTLTLAMPEVNTSLSPDKRRSDFNYHDYRSKAKGKVRLDIRVKGSHSGRITNNRCYPGMMMMNSMHTWTHPYAKPIQSRHPLGGLFGADGPEPVVYGRVYDALYNRLIADDLQFRNDWRSPDPHGEGSGYTLLGAMITDEKAIEDILDRRILTFSTGQRSPSLRCNICGHDWVASRSPCDHTPGQTYEVEYKNDTIKVKAFHVTSYLTYDHCAAANSPADPHAVITGVQLLEDGSEFAELFSKIYSGPQDELQATVAALALVDEQGPTTLCLDEEQAKDAKSAVITVAGFELPSAPHPVPAGDAKGSRPGTNSDTKEENNMGEDRKDGDEPKEEPKDLQDEPKDKPADTGEPKGKEPKDGPSDGDNEPVEDNKPAENEDDMLSDGNILGSIVEANIELDYVAIEAETGMTEEDVKKRIELADAKLTTTARKKLSEGVFCGPDRSFPVPDCSHAANAKSRLVNAKLSSSQKASVLACVNRKAKAMDCFKSKKKEDDSQDAATDQPVDDEVKKLKQDEAKMKQHIDNLKASLTAKTGELGTVLDALSATEEKYRMLLSRDIMEAKRALNKPRSTFDDDAKRLEALDELAIRPLDYLEGAFEDLREELGAPSPRGTVDDPTVPVAEGELEDSKPKGKEDKPLSPEEEEVKDFLEGN